MNKVLTGWDFFQRIKKRFWCFGSGWSRQACETTKRVWMLTKWLKISQNIFWVLYKAFFIISGLLNNIWTHYASSTIHMAPNTRSVWGCHVDVITPTPFVTQRQLVWSCRRDHSIQTWWKQTCVWFCEAAEWVSMLFERLKVINKVSKVLKEYSVKFSAFLVNIQTLPVAAQALPLQPLPKQPNLCFEPLIKIPPPSNFVYKSIKYSTLFSMFYHVICLPLAWATSPHVLTPYVLERTHVGAWVLYGMPQRPWWTLQVTVTTSVLENQPYTKSWPWVARVTNKTKLQTQIVNCWSHWPFNNTLPTESGQGDKTKQNSTPQHPSTTSLNPSKSPFTFIIIHITPALITASYTVMTTNPTTCQKLQSFISFSILVRS